MSEAGAPTTVDSAEIAVVAAVVLRGDAVLLCQRHEGAHLSLMWEFPGGKIDPGERARAALRRELREELAVEATVGEEVAERRHCYPEKRVWLRFFAVEIHGEPRPVVHRRLAWVPVEALAEYRVPPPNRVVVDALRRGELAIN